MNSNFTAKGKTGSIWLYDPIGADFWGDAMSAKMFQKELTALGKVDTINLHINSPGGDVFDGYTIFNQLNAHTANVVVDIDGVAASIASIIAMAGNTIRMAKNAMMMMHNPQGIAVGDEDEMARVQALLKTVKNNLAQTYVDRTGNKVDQVLAWMADTTWLTAGEALERGFADQVTEASQVTACFDLSKFRNVPESLKNRMRTSVPTPVRDRYRTPMADNARRVAALCTAG